MLVAIAAVGLAWRVGYTLATHGDDSRLFDEGDAFAYSAVANSSVDGHWFADADGSHFADHPPLTVLALLPASAAFGGSVLAQRLTMTVAGVLAVAVIGLLGRTVGGRAVGLVAAAVATANPNLWMNDALVMSESLAAVLIPAVLLAAVRLRASTTTAGALAAGLLCALAALCRAELALLLPLVVLPAIGARRWRHAALAAATAVAMALPWSLWSSAEVGRPVLLSTNDATTLVGANCDDTYFEGWLGGWSLFCVLRAERAGGATTGDALRYARAHVGRLPLVLAAREGRTLGLWRPDQQVRSNVYEGRPAWASWAGHAAFWLLLPLSVVGAVALRRRAGRAAVRPFAACAAIVVFVSAAFYGLPRFRLPLDVATCVLGACAIYDAARRWSRSTASSITSRRLQKAKRTNRLPASASS
jgi:4-amino-4-deoxy-L-arabinose transferase-like glycosyltransferase